MPENFQNSEIRKIGIIDSRLVRNTCYETENVFSIPYFCFRENFFFFKILKSEVGFEPAIMISVTYSNVDQACGAYIY